MKLPDFPPYELPSDSNRILSPHEIQPVIRRMVETWQSGDHPQLMTAVDGISGSGKSSMMKIIRKVAHESPGVNLVEIESDKFIRTTRDSPQRRQMRTSERLFWNMVHHRQGIIRLLKGVKALGTESGEFTLRRTYNAQTGLFDHHVPFQISEGRKWVVLDGIDSIGVVDQVAETRDVIKHVLVYAPPLVSWMSASRRSRRTMDSDSKTKINQNLRYRKKEYPYLINRIGPHINREDVIVLDNTAAHPTLEEHLKALEDVMDCAS